MNEPGLLLAPQPSARHHGSQEQAPALRKLVIAASLLTLAAVVIPVLLPQPVAPPAVPRDVGSMAAPAKIVTASPAPQAPILQPRSEYPVAPHVIRTIAAPPAPNPPAAIPANLPAGTMVIPSGEMMRVNQHNRNDQGHDWPISITIVTPPAHGKVTTQEGMALLRLPTGVERNSAVTQVFYQSDAGYTGMDSFTYKRTSADASDPRNANTYTIDVYLTPAGSTVDRSPSPGNRPPLPASPQLSAGASPP